MTNLRQQALDSIRQANHLVFLTGAGVSTPSGVPDYRSLSGVYTKTGMAQPEYLLSHTCFLREQDLFYQFVKQLYHPQAKPNSVHLKMAQLEKEKPDTWVISQNIDQLHRKAGSQQVVDFHGSLYDVYCSKCYQHVDAWTYLEDNQHAGCGGILRPNIVLYEEGLEEMAIYQSQQVLKAADVIVIAGTSFKVSPFCQLIYYKSPDSQVIVVNQDDVYLSVPYTMIQEDVVSFFKDI